MGFLEVLRSNIWIFSCDLLIVPPRLFPMSIRAIDLVWPKAILLMRVTLLLLEGFMSRLFDHDNVTTSHLVQN